ncbi:MAG TPA: hypothetical protein VFD00_01070 [Thermoclostridium sp.]|nr:hypothetical protein [Thermoclostridium sp.]
MLACRLPPPSTLRDEWVSRSIIMKTISNRIIRKLNPCYDPSEVVKDENEELPVKEWVAKYRDLVEDKSDIIWLLCNKLYMSDRDMRLFAVWCAREALKLVDNPDQRSVEACNVAERYANGDATIEELTVAKEDARAAARASRAATRYASAAAARAASSAARVASSAAATWAADAAARAASWDADRSVAEDAQIEQLLTYFK